MDERIYHIEKHIKSDTSGIEYPFTNPWICWKQHPKEVTGKYSYEPICKYSTIAGFWTFINNLEIQNMQRIIFMREGICPEWEDKKHINGAHFIITLNNKQNSYNILLDCLLGLMGESFCNDKYENLNITGLTYINEPFLKQIRIWTSEKDNILDVSKISDEYKKCFENANIDFSKQFLFVTFKKLMKKAQQKDKINSVNSVNKSGHFYHEKTNQT